MPSPPNRQGSCNTPSPLAFQETLAYLVAAYQHVHAETEFLRKELQESRGQHNNGLPCHNAPGPMPTLHMAKDPDSEVKPTESVERTASSDKELPVHIHSESMMRVVSTERPMTWAWMPSTRSVRRIADPSSKKCMDQYCRLAAANAKGLTVYDLITIDKKFVPHLDTNSLLEALVHFMDFCKSGAGNAGQHNQTVPDYDDEDELNEAARCLVVSYATFERLAGDEDLDSYQVLQDDAPILLQLRESLSHEMSSHMTVQKDKCLNVLEATAAAAIALNALFLGVTANLEAGSIDGRRTKPGFFLGLSFSAFFIMEMVLKVWLDGITGYFCGPSRYWNIFDSFFVGVAFLDAAVLLVDRHSSAVLLQGSYWQLVRLLRLARVARLIRLLKFRVFGELRTMVEGVLAGLRVLFWAIVLLISFTYILALVAMVCVNDSLLHHDQLAEESAIYLTKQSFGSVLWSMFTLFRCFTDGCTAFDGTPLQVHLSQHFGKTFMIGYVVIYLFVTVGIFNLIMATFMDYVMVQSEKRRLNERESNAAEIEMRLRRLIADLCQRHSSVHSAGSSSFLDCCWRLREGRKRIKQSSKLDPSMTVSKRVFNTWLTDQRMLDLLDDMDIACTSRAGLFDVLDCNMDGNLQVQEIVSGLLRLRGPAEKCDVIATLFTVKHIMSSVEDLRSSFLATTANLVDPANTQSTSA